MSCFVKPDEAKALADFGCAFEFELYTAVHPIPDRPRADLLTRAAALRETGSFVYFTSDAGQAHVGNPFFFSSRRLSDLADKSAATWSTSSSSR
jgi:hypothetical protein